MNKNIDFKIDNKTVIHAKTAEEANKLCEFLDKLGVRWYNRDKYSEFSRWDIFRRKTCYDVHEGSLGRVNFYIAHRFNIISVEEFLKLHEIEDKKNEIDFKIDTKTVVHAKTKDEAVKLCEFLDKLGATWKSGDRYTGNYRWSFCEVDTCYNVHGGSYGDFQSYVIDGYDVITVDEFLKLHEQLKTIEEDLGAIINSIKYAEKQLKESLENHKEELVEDETTVDAINNLMSKFAAIGHLKSAIKELESIN